MRLGIKLYNKSLLLLVVFLLSFPTFVMGIGWWGIKHNWDGYTPWFHMMTTSAAYLGPNALPIPQLREGLVEKQYQFEFRPEAHFSKGDDTYNLYTSFIAPLKGVASFEVFLVPFEYYKMDTITRDERLARSYNAEGHAGGDFWFGTNIQIIKDKRFPDLLFSAYFKTASGTNLSDARYTDTPGYYLLLNAGKSITINKEKNIELRFFGHLGTFIWQTWSDINSQDDAIVYGIGARIQNSKYFFKVDFSGYHGYLNNGDRPNAIRMQTGTYNNKLNIIARYQIGINDFDYQTIGISLIYQFGKKW